MCDILSAPSIQTRNIRSGCKVCAPQARRAVIELQDLLTAAARLGVALLATVPVAWEREHSTRIMGLRTFPLIAVASCGYVLVALGTEVGGEAEARALQGLITGIGFLGGGAILKEGNTVRGTATAASVWSTGAIGAAAGFGEYGVAVLIGIINLMILRVMGRIEAHVSGQEPDAEE